jgi:predicted enzyme related to lactoylglutathione lyase
MSERSDYNDGEFCWVDLATPDLDASAKFYGDLIGWKFEPAEVPEGVDVGGYGNFTYEGKPVAGMGRIMQEGQPPAWSSYVKVSDADATAAKVKEAGGTVVLGPMDIPGGAGRFMVCQDAEGAFISLWQPDRHRGAELVNEVGSWSWSNLLSRDLDAAKRFYGAVFGWEVARNEEAPPDIFNWQVQGQRWPEGLGGVMRMPEEMPAEVPPFWEVYLLVEDLDRAIEITKAAGGRLVVGPIDIPIARFASLIDPQGAAFSLMQPDYPEPR